MFDSDGECETMGYPIPVVGVCEACGRTSVVKDLKELVVNRVPSGYTHKGLCEQVALKHLNCDCDYLENFKVYKHETQN